MSKLSTDEARYYNFAHKSLSNAKQVQTYYKQQLRLAKYKKQPHKRSQMMLSIVAKLIKKHEASNLVFND